MSFLNFKMTSIQFKCRITGCMIIILLNIQKQHFISIYYEHFDFYIHIHVVCTIVPYSKLLHVKPTFINSTGQVYSAISIFSFLGHSSCSLLADRIEHLRDLQGPRSG